MSRLRLHPEDHFVDRIGWLRAAVLGANHGIVSTASLIVGVAAAAQNDVLIAGVAGLMAGAISMAADEYVLMPDSGFTLLGSTGLLGSIGLLCNVAICRRRPRQRSRQFRCNTPDEFRRGNGAPVCFDRGR